MNIQNHIPPRTRGPRRRQAKLNATETTKAQLRAHADALGVSMPVFLEVLLSLYEERRREVLDIERS